MKAVEYLDAIKARHSIESDYAAAKLLGITRSAVSKYRNGDGSLADAPAIRAAELLGLDPAEVLIDCQIERASDPGTRAAWGALLTRLGAHAAPLLVLALAVCIPDLFESDTLSACGLAATYCFQNRKELFPFIYLAFSFFLFRTFQNRISRA